MNAADTNNPIRRATASALGGAVLAKELFVTSRRMRYYVLRVLYVAAMALFVALAWRDVSAIGSFAYSASRMAEAGKAVTGTIVWVQFVATQILAVILLSTAVSEELHRRTLPLLMTTPISGWQIVTGKLLGKLLHLLLLVAISLPLLAIVRVFGGVPWRFVLASLSVTVCAMIATGAMTLYFSIGHPQPAGTVMSVVMVHVLWVLLAVPGLCLGGMALTFYHPAALLRTLHQDMLSPLSSVDTVYWIANCVLSLAAAWLFLRSGARAVRRAGLASMNAGGAIPGRAKRRRDGPDPASAPPGPTRHVPPRPVRSGGRIRRITGSPLVWKELRFYLPGSKPLAVALTIMVVAVFVLGYVGFRSGGMWDEPGFHAGAALFYLGGGALITAVLSSSAVTAERESGALPILLTTPVSRWHILAAKAVGVFYRAGPLWILLAGHLIFFTLGGYIHPLAAFQVVLVAVGTAVCLTGLGLYFSSRVHLASTAAALTLLVAVAFLVVLPATVAASDAHRAYRPEPRGPLERIGRSLETWVLRANPAAAIFTIMEDGAGRPPQWREAERVYEWPGDSEPTGPWRATGIVIVSLAGYLGLAALLGCRARIQMRKRLF